MFRTFQEVIGKYYLSVGLGEQSSKAEWESALKGLLETKQKTLGTITNPALKHKGERECAEIEVASQMASHLNAFERLRQHIQDDNQESFEWESKKYQTRAAFPSEGHPLYGEFLQVKGEARKKWPGVVFAGAIYRCVRPDFVLVGFINKQSQLVEGRFLLGSSTTARPTDFRVAVADRKSPVNRCMLARKPLTALVESELPLPFLQTLKLKSIRLIPIVAMDNPVGIFILGREKIQSYAMREEMWLEAIVSNVSMGFERAKSSLSSLKLDRSAALTNIT